jgi:integrase
LRKALADAVEVEQVLSVNPAARSKRPKTGEAETAQIWTTIQLDCFLTAARAHRLYAFYRLAAYTGARRGELLYLRWRAVDLEAAEVTFGGSTSVVHGKGVEGTTKGGRSRTISIDSGTVAARLGHADPAVTLRVYDHVLREQAASVGDIFAQAVKASASEPVGKPSRQD